MTGADLSFLVGPFADDLFLSWPALVVVSGLLLAWRWR